MARASVVAHAAGGAGPLPVETAVALAVLAWLEADPAAVGAASVRRAVDVVVDVAGELSPVGARELLSADRTDPAVGEDVVPGAEGEAETPAAEVTPPVAKEEPTAPAPEHTPPPEAGEEETPAAADDHADEHDVLLPARALTSYGGLLFLLGVLDELDIPAGACRTAPLERRPLRWTLHRLALTLAPLAPEDPAALAFAGLPPDADPPGDDDRSQTDEETLALDELAARVEEHLGERLAPADIPPDELLDFVCRRRAEIVFDPGWLELRLPLDEVSVELRRAAIDLDPGWLPWLGVVVRFVYG